MHQQKSNRVPAERRHIGERAVGRAYAAAVLLLACLFLTACASAPGNNARTSGPGTKDGTALSGQEIFASNCAACHGASGEGHPDWRVRNEDGTLHPPPLNGDGHTWHHADGLLYRIVSQGGASLEIPCDQSFKSAMPAFGDQLSREEIIEVLAYVKSLWEGKTHLGLSIRETQAQISERDPFPSEAGP